jgi:hypothetical protein
LDRVAILDRSRAFQRPVGEQQHPSHRVAMLETFPTHSAVANATQKRHFLTTTGR